MGSGADTVGQTIDALHADKGVGFVNVRLYRPFSAEHLLAAMPDTVKSIAVLDRTKEIGAGGEPLYQDVVTALAEAVGERQARVDAAHHRRPLRPVVEGVHAGDGHGGLRRTGERTSQSSTSRSASTTT